MRKILLLIPALIFLVHSPASGEDALSNILQGIKGHYGQTPGLSVPYSREVMTRSMSMLGAQTKGDLGLRHHSFQIPSFSEAGPGKAQQRNHHRQ